MKAIEISTTASNDDHDDHDIEEEDECPMKTKAIIEIQVEHKLSRTLN